MTITSGITIFVAFFLNAIPVAEITTEECFTDEDTVDVAEAPRQNLWF